MKQWNKERPEYIVTIPSHHKDGTQVPHVSGSKMSNCDDCKTSIWISPSTEEVIKEFPGVPIICARCAISRLNTIKEEIELSYLPKALDELKNIEK